MNIVRTILLLLLTAVPQVPAPAAEGRMPTNRRMRGVFVGSLLLSLSVPGLLAAGQGGTAPPSTHTLASDQPRDLVLHDLRPVTSLANTNVRYTVPERPYVVINRGSVEAVVVDNRAVNDQQLPGHAAGYHGLASLRHTRQSRNLFVPSYSGLNFEHIHDGTVQSRDVLFEPRHVPMELRVINQFTAELYQRPTPHWGLESCMRYELLPDGVVELTFECIPRRDAFRNGYCGLFWASYINQPESLDIHFRGVSEGSQEQPAWKRGITSAHGTLATHREVNDQRDFAHDAAFPLELPFGFSRLRYAEPWYFGVYRGMAFVQLFRAQDAVLFSQSPSGGGNDCPAWDFQWFISRPRVGQLYQLKMRAAYLPLDHAEDIHSVRELILQSARALQPK